jgi:predicted sugar kinase
VDVMDLQYVANGLFIIVGILLGLLYKAVRGDVDTVKKEIHEINLLVVGQYVKRDDIKDIMKEIKEDLEKIYTELKNKADK